MSLNEKNYNTFEELILKIDINLQHTKIFWQKITDCITLLGYFKIRLFLKIRDGCQISNRRTGWSTNPRMDGLDWLMSVEYKIHWKIFEGIPSPKNDGLKRLREKRYQTLGWYFARVRRVFQKLSILTNSFFSCIWKNKREY